MRISCLIVWAILIHGPTCARAQGEARRSLEERIKAALDSGQTREAERLLNRLLPNPEAEPTETSGFLRISVYDLWWGTVGYSYLGANDYANAERLSVERLKIVESPADRGAAHLPPFLMLMADVYRLQGKYAAAAPLYQRMYRLWMDDKLPADFINNSQVALAEFLIATGHASEAVHLLLPARNPDGTDAGIAFHEQMYNAYAVALEQAGRRPEAEQLASAIDATSRRKPAANRQDRELFRARLLSARAANTEAEAIYRKWIAYWQSEAAAPSIDPKESLDIRTQALSGFTHFLSKRGRSREAQAAQVRLKAMGCALGLCGWR
jgi:ATP/maltotriose-dependent transcriptional regulator MalT